MAVQNSVIDHLRSMDLTLNFPRNKIQFQSLSSLKKDFFHLSDDQTKLLDSILKTDIGKKFNSTEYTSSQCIESKSFEDFKSRHRSINYARIFLHKKISKRKDYFKKHRKVKGQVVHHYTQNKKCENQIHPAQIREGFQTILYKVVSQELIGNNRNKKKVLKNLHNFLLTAKTEPFSLLNLIKGINLSSIKWVNPVTDELTKYVLVAKFVKWLFQYFITIICYRFHVAYIKEERIFIFIKDWNQQKTDYLKKTNNKMVLEPVNEIPDPDKIKNKLFLIPKREGVRSIMKPRYTDEEKQEIRKIITILKFLYNMYLKTTCDRFSDKYLEIIKEKNDSATDKIYIISTDIFDAYGSIRPAKLFDIIKVLFEKLPNNLPLQWYITRNIKKYKFENDLSKLQNPANKFEIIGKDFILQKLKEYIYNTQVIIGNKTYNLCKGVAQGLMLSAILCDIYYAHMQKKYFSDFKKSGHLFTYVDDSIYITKNLVSATQYENRIMKGIPEYNCWYNHSKIRSNLNNNDAKNQSPVKYLGWKIDPNSLEVQPNFSSPRYSINYVSVSNSTLGKKMQTLTSLKLNKLILCKEVNSNQRIFENVKIIALQQAERCYALIHSVIQNQSNYNLPMKIIYKVSFKILIRVEKFTNWSNNEKKENRKKLQLLIWKSFHRVFSKDNNNFMYLTKELKKLVKKCQKIK